MYSIAADLATALLLAGYRHLTPCNAPSTPVLGGFQFSSAFRRRRPGWHRVVGRTLVVLGLMVAFSAL